ncbi:MAG: hypothetical protein IPP71_01115 [Bacteroidetes bacterium]|nr:hypothetical protein [Bacteroidota bacterium]
MKKTLLVCSLLILFVSELYAQNLALGQWKVHLPYIKTKNIADTGNRLYCASERGLFYYERNDNSVIPLSKITGLAELSVSTIAYDSQTKVLVVAYSNANIDLLTQNKIINVSDIKRKNITGDKNIYGITFYNNLAYLSCGFGIVVLDLIKNEIKDTYFIGANGSQRIIYDISFNGNFIYAAAEDGVYRADINNPSLGNFNNWTKVVDDIGNAGDYNLIEVFDNKIFVNYAKANLIDNIIMFDGNSWVTPPLSISQIVGKNYSFRTSNDKFYITNNYSVSVFDNSLNRIRYIDNAVYNNPDPRDAYIDSDETLWIADFQQGLARMTPTNAYYFIFPNGPQSELVSAMSVVNSHLWITHATRTAGWFNTYEPGNFSDYTGGNWKTYNNKTLPGTGYNFDDFFDMMSIAVDPDNANHAYIGSKVNGVLEMLNGLPVNAFRENNSSLQVGIGNPTQCQAVGMGFDSNKNLWVLNSLAAKPLNVKTPAGDWKAFSIPVISGAPLYGDLTIDSYGQKWVNIIGNNSPLGNGLAVFDDNGTFDDATDDRARFLTTGIGRGNLPSFDIRAIVEDKENEIWVGTGKGVCVFYSPSSIISSNNFDAQQILIKQDGINQYLLETEVVTAIAVDGANRKWIGTESGGVFLMSADGTKQIPNFNENNSPLLSNYIIAISIDQKTGEVFLGTNKGLISYKGDAVDGTGGCKDVLVFPNPVRENYSGPIAIRGLVPNGVVKITDVSGNIVYETKANGTQAIWYGKNFNGEKAHTGVYLVFSTDEEGENTCVTKLLFIN